MTYKYIRYLHHKNPTFSHVAYLYQDTSTTKYYLSLSTPINGSAVNIIDPVEVTPIHFMANQINDYIL